MTESPHTTIAYEDRLDPVIPEPLCSPHSSRRSTPDSDPSNPSRSKEPCEATDLLAREWHEQSFVQSLGIQSYPVTGDFDIYEPERRPNSSIQPEGIESEQPMVPESSGPLLAHRYQTGIPDYIKVEHGSCSVYSEVRDERKPPRLRLTPPYDNGLQPLISPLKRMLHDDPPKDELGSYKLPRLQHAAQSMQSPHDTGRLPHLKDILAPSPGHRRTFSSSTTISACSAPAGPVRSGFFFNSPTLGTPSPWSPAGSYAVFSPSSSVTLSVVSTPTVYNARVSPTIPRHMAITNAQYGVTGRSERLHSSASTGSTQSTQGRRSSNMSDSSTEVPTPRSEPTVDGTRNGDYGSARHSSQQESHSRPVPAGGFRCRYDGCNAPPFATQYLLNSHRNVHSQERPHFCPVGDCKRGPGGRGFKRKNEMIRHQLVHDSPGYICPYCPDQSHRYPRPDNLQRHVTLHHKDKDKTDQRLREVLAVKPAGMGSATGRRRRAT